MLILTRKSGETIAIGDDIEIQILDIKGKHVQVGIRAPRMTPVHRGEVYRRIQEANEQAAHLDPSDLMELDLWLSEAKNTRDKG